MAGLSDLAARIRALEDNGAVKQLKVRYWRCLDKKLWDESLGMNVAGRATCPESGSLVDLTLPGVGAR